MSDSYLEAVWRQYRTYALTARAQKITLDRGRDWSFGLTVLGASMATVAGILDGQKEFADLVVWLAAGSAVALALAGFVGKEFLMSSHVRGWVQLRIVAEGIKRDVWKALLRVPPYEGDDHLRTLQQRVSRYVGNRGVLELEPLELDKPLPTARSVADYITERLTEGPDAQIPYYRRTAARLLGKLQLYRRLYVVFGALAVVFGALGAVVGGAAGFVPLATTIAGTILGAMKAARLEAQVELYQEASAQLWLRLGRFEAETEARRAMDDRARTIMEHAFVLDCERLMARENEAWRTEWQRAEEEESVAPAGQEPVPPAAGVESRPALRVAAAQKRPTSPMTPAETSPAAVASRPVLAGTRGAAAPQEPAGAPESRPTPAGADAAAAQQRQAATKGSGPIPTAEARAQTPEATEPPKGSEPSSACPSPASRPVASSRSMPT